MPVSREEAIAELKRRGVDVSEFEGPPKGIAQRLVETAPAQFALGGAQEASRQLAAVLGRRPPVVGGIIPGRLAPRIGAGFQDIASFLGAGELGGAALGAARAVPALGRAAAALRGPAGRIAGTAAFGVATDPERLRGLRTGLEFGAAGEAIPAVAGAVRRLTPQFITDSVMNYLKGGRESLEENAKSLATDIRNAFKRKKEEAAALYNPLFEKVGKDELSPTSYTKMDQDIFNSYLPDMKTLHNKFIENPTLENAHDLQSQLGFEVRKLENQPTKSIADTRDMQNWRQGRNGLRNDVGTFLRTKDVTGNLDRQYDEATAFFRDNVAPYKSNTALSKIASGITTTPRNINTIFKFPEEDIQRIAEDIGDEGKKKILFSELGKKPKITPEQLSSEIDKLEGKGLASYITPTLQEQVNKLSPRLEALKGARSAARLAGLLGGALAGRPFGGFGEFAGGLAGGLLSPFVLRSLARAIPTRQIARRFPAIRAGVTGLALGTPAPRPQAQLPQITRAEAIAELKRRGVL
jgi:hypothetical protein